MKTSGKLNSHIAEIDKQASDMFFRLVKELAEKENVTEQVKSTDQMLWVQKMNNIRNRATEIVNKVTAYTLKVNFVCRPFYAGGITLNLNPT